MKKFFIVFFILVLIAGAGLFFGWAQLGVPPDSFGVIMSKTHGTHPRLVQAGEFQWVWYKLIPTNTKTAVFRLSPVNFSFSARSSLPSGRVYASFAGIDDDFSWEIDAAITFSLRPEAIVRLVSDNNIGAQEDLANFERETAKQIEAAILRYFDLEEEFSGQIEDLLKSGESPWIEQEIQKQFSAIGGLSVKVRSVKFPDFTLYARAKELYETYIALQKEYIFEDLREIAKNRVDSQFRFDELEQYGELLTKYPILIEYLALEGSRR
jgi:hypothetical protein